MTDDDRRDMWVNCKTCSHAWVALRLPMGMSAAAQIMVKLHCPNCGSDATLIRVGKGKTDG